MSHFAESGSARNNRVALFIESRATTASLQEALTRSGFSPRPLMTLQELAQARAYDHPCAVIADLSLCQRDPGALLVLQSLRERSPAPLLFCLASAEDVPARLQAVRLGATRFVPKPVDADRLAAVVKGLASHAAPTPFRVLFVDDDPTMNALYAAAMQEVGVECRTIENPLACPALIGEFVPDVVVTDLYMPQCDGFELTALLRQDELLTDTPILFLSSETNSHLQINALDVGADDFLIKPLDVDILQATVIARAKRARMLRRSREEFQRVAKHMTSIEMAIDRHSLVSIGDVQGNILYVNRNFCDVSGYSANELLGVNHRIIKSDLHPPEFYREMWDTISRGHTWHGEVCNRRRDGSQYWVRATITPQFDDHGVPVRYVSVRTDITQLKELQAQLIVAKAEAEAASQAKTVFLAHMSHELKTPLNSILGFSQVMLMDTLQPPTTEQADMLGAIERGGRHLLELISDLVDLAKIETGHMGLTMETVSLPPLVRECLALIKPQAQRRGIALHAESFATDTPGTAQVYADRIRVKQVLLNLLSNAVKYNQDQGTITVGHTLRANHCQVYVRDTGPGIRPEDQDELFQPFSRLRQNAQSIEGSGIGLSLSKNLVERMGGRVGVISAPGAGSEFWFELPIAAPR
ncbi:response regulator [Candidatus Symbiobacter mobilis]|uniref:histidine kinase n=1 Tax=Candidatus Symbiobacter mobilis CR TaxID=946483 RepID=U5NBR5_9BURK|nr:response regulator [Candidatus Symbiobacter mobilis]AGX87624.1 signal transduction histidine kinase [Candidatus Symbiobacter mobilis CR]